MRTWDRPISDVIVDGREERNCAECGLTFTPTHRSPERRRQQRYCSTVCAGRSAHKNLVSKCCSVCASQFTPKSLHQKWCRTCIPDKRALMRMTRYGVTQPAWETMCARFDGKCWVCRDASAEYVDHDHKTGRVRGAVCPKCNSALHHVENNGWWAKAVAYLDEANRK